MQGHCHLFPTPYYPFCIHLYISATWRHCCRIDQPRLRATETPTPLFLFLFPPLHRSYPFLLPTSLPSHFATTHSPHRNHHRRGLTDGNLCVLSLSPRVPNNTGSIIFQLYLFLLSSYLFAVVSSPVVSILLSSFLFSWMNFFFLSFFLG